jgi:hypothetical protein
MSRYNDTESDRLAYRVAMCRRQDFDDTLTTKSVAVSYY